MRLPGWLLSPGARPSALAAFHFCEDACGGCAGLENLSDLPESTFKFRSARFQHFLQGHISGFRGRVTINNPGDVGDRDPHSKGEAIGVSVVRKSHHLLLNVPRRGGGLPTQLIPSFCPQIGTK